MSGYALIKSFLIISFKEGDVVDPNLLQRNLRKLHMGFLYLLLALVGGVIQKIILAFCVHKSGKAFLVIGREGFMNNLRS